MNTPTDVPHHARLRPDATTDAVSALYATGMTKQAIAKKLGRCEITIDNQLAAAGWTSWTARPAQSGHSTWRRSSGYGSRRHGGARAS